MSFLPNDLPSFMWGAGVGALVLFLTGFLNKAGEHGFEWTKRKFTPDAGVMTAHDKELFKSFKALFSDSGIIKYYKEHHFLLPFNRNHLTPLTTVVECWNDESHNFINGPLQEAKIRFLLAADALAEEISHYTVPDGNGSVSVITRDMDHDNLPNHVKVEAKEIDSKLPEFVQSHEHLIRLGQSLS